MSYYQATTFNPYLQYSMYPMYNWGYNQPMFMGLPNNTALPLVQQQAQQPQINTTNLDSVTFSANKEIQQQTKEGLSTGAKWAIGIGATTALAVGADFLFCKGKHVKSLLGKNGKSNGSKGTSGSSVGENTSSTTKPSGTSKPPKNPVTPSNTGNGTTNSSSVNGSASSPNTSSTSNPPKAQTKPSSSTTTNTVPNKVPVNATNIGVNNSATSTPVIKRTTLPNPILVKYDKLLNEGEMTLQKAEELVHEFYKDTGLVLHCPSNQNRGAFNQTLSAIMEAVHNGTFPKEIKHVVIGHGNGNSLVPHSWEMSGPSLTDGKTIEIFEYVNNAVKNKGEEVLVCCCETAGRGVAGKPGIGHKVDLSLTNTGSFIRGIGYTGPAKIVRAGENEICGHYTVTEGRVLYE